MSRQWLNGQLLDEGDPQLAELEGPRANSGISSFTTALVCNGKALHEQQHVRRLQRDATAIGLAPPDAEQVLEALAVLGRDTFGGDTGIVRIEVRPGRTEGATTLHATPQPLGDEPQTWTANIAPMTHHGPQEYPGVKLARCKLYEEAREFYIRTGVDDALLFDKAGRLVEGARTNVIVVDADGALLTPDLALGAVSGIGLEVVRTNVPQLETAELFEADVRGANEIIATNAVRGAIAITRLDGKNVGDGRRGKWAERLARVLSSAP